MFFGGQLFDVRVWFSALVTFAVFSLAASAVYCLNDELDLESDRLHPEKCRRPLASGTVSVSQARQTMWLCLSGSVCAAFMLGLGRAAVFMPVLLGYLLMNVLYCVWLKQIPVVDVLTVAAGFVLRVVGGGVACGIWLSPWILLMTFVLTVFLALAKRRYEVQLSDKLGRMTRSSVRIYKLPWLDHLLCIQALLIGGLYIAYSLQPAVEERYHSHRVWITAVFVVGGLLRYLWLAARGRSMCPTTMLLHDKVLQLLIAAWLLTFGLIAYQ